MTTGVIYARVSSIGDRQSTERQVKDLSEYAKYKGIEVCKVFAELEGVSLPKVRLWAFESSAADKIVIKMDSLLD